MENKLDINNSNIEWDKVMIAAARDKEKQIFMMAAQKTDQWREVCISILNDSILDDDIDGLKFIYKFYIDAELSPDERNSFLDSFIPLGKIKLLPEICELDKSPIYVIKSKKYI